MTKNAVKNASRYTAAHEAAITAASEAGKLNQAAAEKLAAQFGSGFSTRGVIAKISRMGLPYERKVATTKTGGKVEQKEAIVAEIAKMVEGNLDGLDKAPKATLQTLRDYLAA